MDFLEVFDLIKHNGGYGHLQRDTVYDLAFGFKYRLVEDQRGYYDYTDPVTGEHLHRDGYHVYESPEGEFYRVDFTEDSYSGGYAESITKVEKKTVTKDVWVKTDE